MQPRPIPIDGRAIMPHREMPVALLLELDPQLFFDPNVSGRLFHATFQGALDRELEHDGVVTCSPACTFGRGGGGRTARVVPELSSASYGTSTAFLPIAGNQIVWDMAVRFTSFPAANGLFWQKGLNLASAGTAFIGVVMNTGSVTFGVRLADATQLSITSAGGAVTLGQDHTIRFLYNGQAGSGNDTLAIFVDGVKVANDDTQSAGLDNINNTTTNNLAFSTTNPAVLADFVVTEGRIRTGTV